MSGNVWEWVWDQYGTYPSGPVVDPTGGVDNANYAVARGGSWDNAALDSRSAKRDGDDDIIDGNNGPGPHVGFRPARTVPP